MPLSTKISFESFSSFILQFVKAQKAMDSYIESVPADIRDAIFANSYSEGLQTQLENSLKFFLPADLYEDFQWFREYLYSDFKNKPTISIENDNNPREYVISSVEAYLEYIKIEFFS